MNGTGTATHRTTHDWFFTIYRNWLRRAAMFPSPGNHDSRAPTHGRAYLDLFVLPEQGGAGGFPDHAERYYSFDYGPVHVVVLATEYAFQGTDTARRDAQLAWLDADLSATSQPWKIAVFHRSPYSAGGEHGSDLAVRAAFTPLFDRHGVQLAISAHEHVYERTVPMRASQPDPGGTTYIVTGGGGGPLYPSGTGPWTAYSGAFYHYLKATVADCRLLVDAVTPEGRVADSVTIDRCGTGGGPAPSAEEIVLHAANAARLVGNWTVVSDQGAASGRVLVNPDRGAAKRTAALAAPADYAEVTFAAQAGVPDRLWMRGRAQGDLYYNDSVFVQFSGVSAYAIGSTGAAEYNLEECSGCGISGWGWQDNGWGAGVLGPTITFSSTGPQTLRLQPREDGLAIDQIILSPERFFVAAPGAPKNDTTIHAETQGSGGTDTPPPPPEVTPSWTGTDVGAVGVAGSTTVTGGSVTLRGAGADVWGTADALHFAWRQVSGDFEQVAIIPR